MENQERQNFQDIVKRRADFPSLARQHNGHTLAFFDGPGGTQVPQAVIDAILQYYMTSNANTHGSFITSQETDRVVEETREAMAAFLGAESNCCLSFGANMTSLTFSLSKAIGRFLQPGEEILITRLDHEANRGPWLALRERGIRVREAAIKPDCTLDYEDFRSKLTESTRLVAVGLAANAFGTVNDLARIRRWAYEVGAWLLVDAVHYAPHFPLDVQALGMDFLLCSAYKFYGPHVGILYSREGLLDRIQTDRLRTQDQQAPYCIETGTLNHAAIAGVKAAVEYIGSFAEGDDLRTRIVGGMGRIAGYEHELARSLYDGLHNIPGVTIYGPPFGDHLRAPTISFTVEGQRPEEVCRLLAGKGICAWNGHFYAIRPMEVLGLLERGGVTRLGISLYNTMEEIERVVAEIKGIAALT
jgi:cysteine desulfurase family protein (TIGR01976 family)